MTAHHLYATILDMVDALVAVVDAEGQIVGFNDACERVSGYTFDEMFGKHYSFLLAPGEDEKARELIARLKQLSPQQKTYIPHHSIWQTRDGRRRHIDWSTTALFDENGAASYIVGTGVDVTDRREMQRQIAEAHRRVAQAREAERLRLAQDLHDDAVQQLLGLSYQVADMQRRAAEPGSLTPAQQLEELIPALDALRGDLITVARGLRRLISSLRPPALRELGLSQVLEAYVQDWRQKAGSDAPRISLQLASLRRESIPEPVAICIFRLIQEALWNVHRHAAADRVQVTVDCKDGEIMLRVRDDGRGFLIPSHLFQFAASGRFGFIGMQERVHAINGLLSVWSEPGRGTEIQAHLPLSHRETSYEFPDTGTPS